MYTIAVGKVCIMYLEEKPYGKVCISNTGTNAKVVSLRWTLIWYIAMAYGLA